MGCFGVVFLFFVEVHGLEMLVRIVFCELR